MEGTIYLLLDCKCLTELHSDCGDCSFCLKKKSLLQNDLQYKNCKAGQMWLPPQEKVVQEIGQK